jgi:hypothetical protein
MGDGVVPFFILKASTTTIAAGEAEDEECANEALLKSVTHVGMASQDPVIVNEGLVTEIGCLSWG